MSVHEPPRQNPHPPAPPKGSNSTLGNHSISADIEQALAPRMLSYLRADVDPAQSTGPLSAYCFMTGFMCASTLLPLAAAYPLMSPPQ